MAREVTARRGQPADEGQLSSPGLRPLPAGLDVLWDELAAFVSWLRERELWSVLLIGLTFWALAYQLPYSFHLEFGGERLLERRRDDEPYLAGAWNPDPEPSDQVWLEPNQPSPYRWAFEQAELHFPGLGEGPWRVSIEAAGQPKVTPTYSTWSDGATTTTVSLTQTPRVYQHVFQATNGDLTLSFDTSPYLSEADPRALGFVIYNITIRPIGGFRIPALSQLCFMVVVVGFVYGIARRLGVTRHWMLLVGVLLTFLLTLLLAFWRLPLTVFTAKLAWLSLGCYGLALVLLRVPLRVANPQVAPDSRRVHAATVTLPHSGTIGHYAVVGLVVLAFAVRLGGMLHPHYKFSDIGLNVNNQLFFNSGSVYQTEGLPAEAGGGDAPYPPGQYIVLAPLQLLFPSGRASVELLLQIGNALLDSLVVGAIWYVLRRRLHGQLAALIGALLYVLPPPALKSFSVGEFANLFGQGLTIPLLVALATVPHRLREPRVFGVVLALMLFALLGHSGVTISVVLLLGYLGLVWLVGPRTWRNVRYLLMLSGIAALLVGVVYHSAFVHLFATQASAAYTSSTLSFATKLGNELNRVFAGGLSPLTPLVVGLGALGVVVIAKRQRHSFRLYGFQSAIAVPSLWPLLLAWWGSIFLSLVSLLVRAQTVRWDLFLYPALCLGVGPLLAQFWRRGWAARVVVVVVLAFLLLRGLIFWLTLIINYLHV